MHVYINNSLHLVAKICWDICPRTLSVGEAISFSRAQLKENCELRGTDNVQGQIVLAYFRYGGYHVYYPSNLFHNTCSFENDGIFLDIPQF